MHKHMSEMSKKTSWDIQCHTNQISWVLPKHCDSGSLCKWVMNMFLLLQDLGMSKKKYVIFYKNYTSVDPKQFTVSKFRLKPVILISECFCSRCGHTNQHPPPTCRETTGDNGRQDHFRAQEGGHTKEHPPPTWRETTGDNGRQHHFRAQEADHTNQHQGGHI